MPTQESMLARARRAAHEQPEWSTLSSEEVEELVVKLAKDGKQSATIGLVLRDQYAVPDVRAATGRSITHIMAENDLAPQVPEDLRNLMRRALTLREHLRDNRRDKHNARGLQLMESRIRKLVKYYKRKGTLPYEWKYSEQTAKLLVE